MKPFILNRTDERCIRSVGRIVLYALVFFIVTRLASSVLIGIVNAVYLLGWDMNAMKLLGFFDLPEILARHEGWWAFPDLLLFTPLFEETSFRLGLSFRRAHVAVGLGALTVFLVVCCLRLSGVQFPVDWAWALPSGIAVGAALWFSTTDAFWLSKRDRWQRPVMWVSAILFGLAHLFAMPGLTWALLPMALTIAFMLALSGCVLVYLRVNLGFWWGVGAHALINLIGAFALLRILLG